MVIGQNTTKDSNKIAKCQESHKKTGNLVVRFSSYDSAMSASICAVNILRNIVSG